MIAGPAGAQSTTPITAAQPSLRTATTVDQCGSDPGAGIRAAWFPSRRIGVGYEFHWVKLRDAAPAIAIGAGWIEDNQSLVNLYVRLNRCRRSQPEERWTNP